jgi:hypothetical protein
VHQLKFLLKNSVYLILLIHTARYVYLTSDIGVAENLHSQYMTLLCLRKIYETLLGVTVSSDERISFVNHICSSTEIIRKVDFDTNEGANFKHIIF